MKNTRYLRLTNDAKRAEEKGNKFFCRLSRKLRANEEDFVMWRKKMEERKEKNTKQNIKW